MENYQKLEKVGEGTLPLWLAYLALLLVTYRFLCIDLCFFGWRGWHDSSISLPYRFFMLMSAPLA